MSNSKRIPWLTLTLALLWTVVMAVAARADCVANVPGRTWKPWERVEIPVRSNFEFLNPDLNPSRDLELTVTFTEVVAGNRILYTTRGFWYGLTAANQLDGKAFCIRGAFPNTGTWRWKLTCKRRPGARPGTPDCSAATSGLNNVSGEFVIAGTADGLLAGGFLKVKKGANPTIAFDNGDKFFWLGDTVWNANVGVGDPSNPDDTSAWDAYLDKRTEFSVLQMAFAPQFALKYKQGGPPPLDERPFVNVGGNCPADTNPTAALREQKLDACHRFNPLWWKAFDKKVQQANAKGKVVVLSSFIDPINDKSQSVDANKTEALYFAEAVTARMLGNFVIFSPGFDHRLGCLKDNINAVGAGIRNVDLRRQPNIPARSIHLITNHVAGNTKKEDYNKYIHKLPWLDFELFQSGTPNKAAPDTTNQPCPAAGDDINELVAMTDRAVSLPKYLLTLAPKPLINGESVYPGTDPTTTHNAYRARQTAWLTMLAGAQGYTMGVCGVWNGGLTMGCESGWNEQHQGVKDTIKSMEVMRTILEPLNWSSLRSVDRIKDQPNSVTADKKRVLAWDMKTTFVAYVPNEQTNIKINFIDVAELKTLRTWPDATWSADWYNPRTGDSQEQHTPANDGTAGVFLFTKPEGAGSETCEQTATAVKCKDWVLRITKGAVTQPPNGNALIHVVNGANAQSEGSWITARVSDVISKSALSAQTLNDDGASVTGAPQIATATGGTSMVVWQSGRANNAKILGRILNAQGVPLPGPEILIAEGRTAWPGHPAVAAVGTGFLVAWAGADPANYGPWIRTRKYTASGAPENDATVAVACEFIDGDAPQILRTDTAGGYLLAWEMRERSGIYILNVEAGGARSEARIAGNSTSMAVLQSLEIFPNATTVTYGLFNNDGTPAGGGTQALTFTAPPCPVKLLALPDNFITTANTPLTIAYREFLENDAPGAIFDHADSRCTPNADGQSCTYTPTFGFTGTDTLTYTVRDAANQEKSAVVTITVLPPLVANPDTFTVEGDASIDITSTQLLSNDSEGAVFVDALDPVNGTVTCEGDSPAVCTFVPTASFRGTASFSYRISRDGDEPYTTGTVTITVRPPSQFDITARCTSGVCVLTAIAPNAQAARAYVWRIGNAPSDTSVYKINHRFGANGDYPVSVTVIYNFGLPQQTASTTVSINDYAPAPTWRQRVSGLGFNLDEFDLSMFPGTIRIPTINWSADSGDCAAGTTGCGNVYAGPDTSCFLQNCRLYGSYSHTGIFDATLRIEEGGVVLKSYPVAMEAINQAPSPSFTVSRPNPNVRDYVFTNINHGDDGPFPVTYAWNFGDGSEDSGGEDKTHTYPALGTYDVTLTVMDGDSQVGTFTLPVQVTNAPPVPRLTVNCRGLECEFGAEGSTDDGANIEDWSWNFGDGQNGSGSRVVHPYAAGCYTVTLTITDGDGESAMTSVQVVAGPPLVAENTEVVVDAHVQSYYANVNGVTGWHTTNGNLNGILEPGETVVVEPTWQTQASTQQLPVSVYGTSSWGSQYGFRHTAPWYDISAGVSDCWSLGDCHAVYVLPQYATNRPLHADIQFNETNLSTGTLTPGSPVTLHIGTSFSDVPNTHWSYAGIESVLHFGVDNGCGGSQFCPAGVLTRGEIARWLLKAEYDGAYTPPACTTAPFNDVPCTHPYAAWIAQLKAEGITSGTGDGNYAPDQPITRAEAAVLILRTAMGAGYAPPACSPDFGDVACEGAGSHWAAAWISDLKTRGISKGCDRTEFCPGEVVDRAQAAALFAKAFELRIDTLQCPIVTNNGYDFVPAHVDLPPIAGITFNPNPAVAGSTSTATMTIGDPPPVATTIAVSIDSPAASVPATVNVPARATSATFTVTPAEITTRTTTHITATYLGEPTTVSLDICTRPATISAQPASVIINYGQSTTLSVTANGGGGPLTYQWYAGTAPSTATPVQNGTGNTLTVTPSATTSYWVRVSATCGGVNSINAIVTVCHPPQIPGPPLNDYVVLGSPTTLTATVTGSGPLTYQWYEGVSGDTSNPVGTDTTFTTPAITVARSYWLRVTSTCNGTVSVSSPTATITPVTQITRRQMAANSVNSLTSITTNWTRPTQPGSLLVAVMSSAHVSTVGNFSVPAGWLPAVSYEWNNLKTAIYYYPNNPGGRTSETIATASFRESVLQLIEYVAATATPLDATAFDGDQAPRPGGEVSTGTTNWMSQPKAVLVSAFSTTEATSFTNPTNGFSKLDERSVYQHVTAAVHDRMVNAIGNYGHSATVAGTNQWLGVIATFRSINDCTTAPSISAHPLPATINAGLTTTLSVTAAGGGLSYQWYEGASGTTTNPVGTNSASFTTPALSSTKSYWVRVSNACGTASSNAATVNVCAPLAITTHPLSQSVTSGFAATLSVTTTGSGPLTYQWYEGASGVTTTPVGTSSATFTTPALTANKTYWVRITSTCNGTQTVNSNAAALTVSSASQIARRQLAANTANSQTSITTNWTQPTQAGSLLVAVLSAQHGAVVGNLTAPAGWVLATSNEMANLKSAIYYYPNHPGGRTSETFGVAGFRELVLQLLEYTGATATPLDKVATSGDMTVTNGIVSTGTTTATSQAKEVVVTSLTMMANASFTNATNGFTRLDQRNVYNSITGSVYERITSAPGAYGHAAEADANNQWIGLVATFKSLDLCSSAPSITTQPASQSIHSGQTATLSVTATTSGGSLSYQWYEGASGITTTPVGTNSASFTTPALSATKSYWVRVTNECGNVASTAATVTVCIAPSIGTQPLSSTINSGQTATLSVTATGSAPLTYQWYEGASGVTTTPVGTNSASFTTPALSSTKSYWVRVTSTCNGTQSVNSNAAIVTVCAAPSIATQPASIAINSGATTTLSVVAGGSAPFTYQWYEGTSGTTTTPVGTNSASFTTPALTTTKSYWVRITNTCNGTQSVNSATATVTVCNATGISTQPLSQTINSGGTATLSVTATGSAPFTYQWYEGASGVTTTPAGTNSASFTTPALSSTKSYWVRVSGGCGTANSNTATITVCTPPSIVTQPVSQTISNGSTATLSVVAGGSAPFSYQWYEGASGVTTTPVGTNSASFTTPALTITKSYWVRVTNTCNGTQSANSNAATITVNAAVIARRQLATNTANSQLTITGNWGQPTQAGNLLVAIVSAERQFYPIANWQAPAGWQLAVSYEMTNVKTAIYYYANNPGGRTAETFSNGGYYDDMIIQLAEYTGVVTVSPLDKTAFNGNTSNDGYVDTNYTQQTSQAKELVITALTAHATTEFSGASQGFAELDDRNQGFGNLTTAIHEKIVTTASQWGHSAQVTSPAEWVGVVATFKGQ